ncbi:thioredoxin domain-containing protein [Bacillus sonorensis]|uniref:thioredoxin domain-containing protein n=2 Tax=Bacillus sonorensis TaxID=119858 RepID=UPI001F189690|nr:thioredoxin domain-containing protein [Bacillus sonorensis]MCF7620072.1 thioredoxin domain-containing protein [Bacillus sonorensis]MCY7857186.1 thioredoxin domain-containing protein [Bacillus sonorensis]MCZ0069962.1 thioredoxin domain-containing protein [Bacillus sonorensis]MCZ0097350.1 thioredoxin domain-containing protein [Bacillus sonorensis]MEC1355138.1 thioredoxin domain-containing protein [Bacillus sonorensis]
MPTNNKPNRLIAEKSPYLLQHAHNPVDWFPWGEEAFEKAKRENKPVLVSIGYSTCHWCHVMAHESFEDEEVAQLLNEKFVSIKVDREERPDVDSIYMTICQMMTGQGGWPLNVFLTPEQKPFYAGTYFPKTSRYNRPGFVEVLKQLSATFAKNRDHVEDIAEKAANNLRIKAKSNAGEALGEDILKRTYQQLINSFDTAYGGFGSAPKFPIPHMLTFLLRYHQYSGEENALYSVTKTLDSMANGGIYDHIGYGFARYSTDQEWLVPHFEKMLYDNALLLMAYTEAYQVTKRERYKRISEQIIAFIRREMTDERGAFFSALDADTEGVEGKYYIWSKDEITETLGDELGSLYCAVYDITDEGNFEGFNIPNLIYTSFEQVRDEFSLTETELQNKLEEARQKLFEKRRGRIYPHVDDKVLTSWNALMIAGLAKASKVFEAPEYLEMARTALSFIEDELIKDGRVMVRYRDGEVKNKGFIDDYAFLLWSYLELYEASLNLPDLRKAKELAGDMIDLFWDEDHGGFYFTGKDAEALIVRDKEVYDGALPSGNGVAAVQLFRLGRLTGDLSLIDRVSDMFSAFHGDVSAYPSGHTNFLQSLLSQMMPQKEIVILGKRDDPNRQNIIRALQQAFQPNYAVLAAESPDDFKGIADFAADYKAIDDKTTVYICENFACQKPTANIDEALKRLLSV